MMSTGTVESRDKKWDTSSSVQSRIGFPTYDSALDSPGHQPLAPRSTRQRRP